MTIVAVAAATALALVFFMISSVTGAAWVDTTDNTDNSWASAEVSLTDDRQPDSVMFETDNIVPGYSETNAITVINESSVPLDVRLYAANLTGDNDLAAALTLTISTEEGDGDVYDGDIAAFAAAHTEFSNGTPVIEFAVDHNETYTFEVSLPDGASQDLANSSAQVDFVWEGQTQ